MEQSLADVSKSELAQRLSRYKQMAKNLRGETERAARIGTNSVLVAAGGAAAGVLAVKMPVLPGTKVPTDLVAGTALVVAAMLDMGGSENDKLAAVGSGLLAAASARETQALLLRQ